MTEKQIMTDVLIVGAGTAGLTAAVYAARAGKSVKLVEQYLQGGQIINASHVENFPGFESIAGFEFAEALYNQAIKMGAEIVYDKVTGLQDYGSHKGVRTEYGGELLAKAVILATGARVRPLGLENEDRFIGSGVSYCATCDGAFFKDKNVAVVGGGNVAMDAARCAKRLGAENVYIVYRRGMAELPARKEEVEHAEEEGIVFKTLTNPTEVLGDENGWVKGMTCVEMELGEPDASGRRRPIVKEGSEFVLDVDTMIMALGTSPNPLIRSTTPGLETNKHGCIVTEGDEGKTSRDGVYAGGDAVTGAATVIKAMGAGKAAAKAMDEYIRNK